MLVLALTAAAAVFSAGYQSMSPTGQWFGRAFCRARRGSRQIALTFDDGPNDPHTLKLLDVLSRHGVPATFFLIGRYVRERPDIVREVARRGHAIGNHTFTHPLLILEPSTSIRREIVKCRETIHDAVGEHSNLFRPPWGGRRPGTFRLVRKLGLEPVMWNVTGYDWNPPSVEFIEDRVRRRARGGDVILLHDGGHAQFGSERSKTVEAVDRLLRPYKDQFEFVTVPTMMGRTP
ncbi:MAG: polysaccharide deacetylase family protein [Acidobacteria bacterium]|nr:polysaccharide deacetylase family protein [Acidobacteriota bacterium]